MFPSPMFYILDIASYFPQIPSVEIETKYHPWDFSPILNVIITHLSPGITGWLGATNGKVTQLLPITGIERISNWYLLDNLPICYP